MFFLSWRVWGGAVAVWGVTGVGAVGVMDRGCAIKFSCGRAVVSVAVRRICGKYINLEKRLAVA